MGITDDRGWMGKTANPRYTRARLRPSGGPSSTRCRSWWTAFTPPTTPRGSPRSERKYGDASAERPAGGPRALDRRTTVGYSGLAPEPDVARMVAETFGARAPDPGQLRTTSRCGGRLAR